ncbi:hypothetical protein PCAR4_830149 [Paraburkholderia caribensis]|nr:hypothetical protein PCAR4_830149 [Paraburkholderia caribensis]
MRLIVPRSGLACVPSARCFFSARSVLRATRVLRCTLSKDTGPGNPFARCLPPTAIIAERFSLKHCESVSEDVVDFAVSMDVFSVARWKNDTDGIGAWKAISERSHSNRQNKRSVYTPKMTFEIATRFAPTDCLKIRRLPPRFVACVVSARQVPRQRS